MGGALAARDEGLELVPSASSSSNLTDLRDEGRELAADGM